MVRVTLLERTLELVRNRPRSCTYAVIAKKTKIPLSWIEALMAGKIDNPGVTRIEQLHFYFTKSALIQN